MYRKTGLASMFARIPAPDERGWTVKWHEQLRRYRLASPSFGLQCSKPTSVRAWVQARPQSSATPELSSLEDMGAPRAYRNLIYFNEVDKGGHFAAWEELKLFSAKPLRPVRISGGAF